MLMGALGPGLSLQYKKNKKKRDGGKRYQRKRGRKGREGEGGRKRIKGRKRE